MASKQQHPITSKHDDPHDDVTATWIPLDEPVSSLVARVRTRYELTRDAREFCEAVDNEFIASYARFR